MSCWKCSDQRWGADTNYNHLDHLLTSFPGDIPPQDQRWIFHTFVFFSSCSVSGWNLCTERLPKKVHPWETSTTSHLSTTVLSTKNGSVQFLFEEKQFLNQKLWRLFFTRSPNTLPKPYIHSKTTSRRDWSIAGRYICCLLVRVLPLLFQLLERYAIFSWRKNRDRSAFVWKHILNTWSQRLVFSHRIHV